MHKSFRLTCWIALSLSVVVVDHGDSFAEWQDEVDWSRVPKDVTGSPELTRHQLDYDYIRGDKPSFAEQRGLAGAATVEVRRNFVYVQDTDGVVPIPLRRYQDLFTAFDFTMREMYTAVPDEFVFIYFYTAFRTGIPIWFYQPEANATLGIGDRNVPYDMNGASPREGFVFMNHYRSFEESFGPGGALVVKAQMRSVFNQEAGHRWCSFVTAGTGNAGNGPDELLGRDDGHWSYFMHTGVGGSPMEGNAWRDNNNGTFTTVTTFQNWVYNDLDLYLMGLKPRADVRPWFVIENPVIGGQRDISGQPLSKASPPQIFDTKTIQGTRADMTIDNVVFVNGPRNPLEAEAPKSWRSVFVILAGQTGGMSESDKLDFEAMVDDVALGFHQATDDIGSLDYVLMEPKIPIGGACQMVDECDPVETSACQMLPTSVSICTRTCMAADTCPMGWCCDSMVQGASQMCMPGGMCQEPDPVRDPNCTCNTNMDCEANCSCDTDCMSVDTPCDCDATYSCDRDATGENTCTCDPECLAQDDEGTGCGCRIAHKAPSAGSALAGLFLLGSLFLFRFRNLLARGHRPS